MRTVLYLVQKEFLQIFRNKTMLPLMLVMPIFQMLLLSFAANYEVKDLKMRIVDLDLSGASRALCSKFSASPNFKILASGFSAAEGMESIARDEIDILLQIPPHFERDLLREGHAGVALTLNAINATKAGLANGYAGGILRDFNAQYVSENPVLTATPPNGLIEVTYSNWYNPRLDYKTFMVPGILGEIVSLIICFLTALNIVREREMGTIEQLNVTPIRKWQFILGKFIPFWIISLFIMTLGLTIGKLVFDIPLLGSLWLVFGFTAAFMPCVLGLGFLISNFAETQQQAMFTAWFFILIFILMCGLFTPIESMPEWAQKADVLNPIAYFVQFMRMVLLKGANFQDVKGIFYPVLVYGIGVNALAIWTYRKQVA